MDVVLEVTVAYIYLYIYFVCKRLHGLLLIEVRLDIGTILSGRLAVDWR